MEKALYGGDGLAHKTSREAVLVPFALPGELIAVPKARAAGGRSVEGSITAQILEISPDRVEPRCVHFGVCGGCQYQMASYPAQMAMKESILRETLARAGVVNLPALQSWASPEPYGYRNRIRLRVRRSEGELRLGYSLRGTKDFLPITMCPIAAPLLWRAAEALVTTAQTSRDLIRVLEAASEVELFCDAEETRLQLTLLAAGRQLLEPSIFSKAMDTLKGLCPELTAAGCVRIEPHSGRPLETVASWGMPGLAYTVASESYWISRGGFFQVNRFLLPTLLHLVCGERSGALAWDLFAGVGLFTRLLARQFEAVTAVEASPSASEDLRRMLIKAGTQHRAVEATTLQFLSRAILERERPELIVLDPPRAGAGEEVCHLLARFAPAEIIYLSCDPTTLARDLAVLTSSGYALNELHLIDLFPQTYHLETLAVLRRAVAD